MLFDGFVLLVAVLVLIHFLEEAEVDFLVVEELVAALVVKLTRQSTNVTVNVVVMGDHCG